MAVVFVEGFDMYNGVGGSSSTSVGLASRWTVNSPGINGAQMTTGRFGGQAVSVANNTGSNPINTTLPGSYTAGTIGVAIYLNTTLATNAWPIFAVGQGSVARSSAQVYITGNADGSINVYRGGGTLTLLGTTAAGILASFTWQYIEMEYVISSTVGSVSLYVSGSNVLTLSGINTQGLATNTVSAIYLEGQNGRTWFDDLYVTDTAARLGEQRVVTTYPDADVTNSNWTANSGSVLYSRINETTCDGDTTYIYAGTVNATSTFGVQDLPVVPNNVKAVQISTFGRKSDTGYRTTQLQYINAGGSVASSSDYVLQGSYTRQIYLNQNNPFTSSPWTASEINAMKVGVKVTA